MGQGGTAPTPQPECVGSLLPALPTQGWQCHPLQLAGGGTGSQACRATPENPLFCPTGDIPFPTEAWTRPAGEVAGWEDWFAMQGQLEEKLGAVLSGRYMSLLWANAGKPRPEEGELRESVRRLVTDFHLSLIHI